MEISSWTKSHFCTYLFLCIANADNNLQLKEITTIQDFLERMHIDKKNSITIIEEVKKFINNQNPEERLDFIKVIYSKLSLSKQQINAIMEELEEMILADNSIEKTEIMMYSKIRKAIEISD